jgi:tRNA (guanine-N7-)-methyltransferase
MSFGLGHGRDLDPAGIALSETELPPLPDAALTDAEAGRIDPRAWFPNPAAPLDIEIGCGKGTFILEQARSDPSTNFLGIEIAGEFFAYGADRVRRAGLSNVRMMRADAVDFLRWRCDSGVVRTVHLYFSDPWPKRKHHKNRVVQDGFLADCWRVLSPGGELRVVTDHSEYFDWMREHFARWTTLPGSDLAPTGRRGLPCALPADRPAFTAIDFESPRAAAQGEIVGTNFERKYRREGRPFHSAALRRVP